MEHVRTTHFEPYNILSTMYVLVYCTAGVHNNDSCRSYNKVE